MSTILQQLITDRTQADVKEWLNLRAKGLAAMSDTEKEKWMAGMKGSYNASDLNRATEAMVYLANLYRQFGYTVAYTPLSITHADGTTDTTWQLTDIPTDGQMAALLQSLTAFWASVEAAEMTVVDVWGDSAFGYVDLDYPLSVGEYAAMITAHGVTLLTATIESGQLEDITVAGTGWVVTVGSAAITATYTVPLGTYEDLQDALDALVLLCTSDEEESYADAAVSFSATLRSGATVELGTGTIHWSGIINWAAFEAYAYTWAGVEAAEMTWADLESLPTPAQGGDA